MKKGYLFGLLVSMMGSAACADAPAGCPKAFQGFYLGGNIGYGIASVKQKLFALIQLLQQMVMLLTTLTMS